MGDGARRGDGVNGRIQVSIGEGRDLLAQQEKSQFGLMKDLKDGSMMTANDMDFDKKRWKEIEKYRKTGDQLNKKEKAVLASLNESVRAEWKNNKFSDVIDYLSTASGQTIVVDKKALEDQNVNYEESVVNFVAP